MTRYFQDSDSCTDSHQICEYENLGKELMGAIMAYGQHLRQKHIAGPSPSLGGWKIMQSSNQEIIQEKNRVFHFCSCLKVVLDLGIEQQIKKGELKSAQQLAKAVGADPALIVRVMRVVMTKYVFAEPEPNVYCHTPISRTMQEPAMRALLLHRLDEGFRSASRQPDALRLNDYHEPIPGDINGFNLAFGSRESFWEFMDTDNKRGERFDQAMKAVTINNLSDIPNLYPFESLVKDGGIIVDVGGGLGQVSRQILACHSEARLQCIVQDRQSVVNPPLNESEENPVENGSSSASALSFQEHDFFNPQPVQGAAAYLFRHIFHDWPDAACIKILRQTVPAMDPEHSRILICDQIVDDKLPSMSSVLYDVDMMTLFGGKERTLPEFLSLIKQADPKLYIENVKRLEDSGTTMIEVRLASESKQVPA
ncbi:O-methyltransferase-domain-containing protein [Bipolaris maydis]|nr:O-methyltransferase-domain-containing protein [Bipolaris maydis]